MTREAIRKELLSYGMEDLLGLWWIAGVVARHIGIDLHDERLLMPPTLDAVRDLLDADYAVAGDAVKNDQGILYVRPWGLTPSETVVCIEKKWRELTELPNLGDVVWLELSAKGKTEFCRLSQR